MAVPEIARPPRAGVDPDKTKTWLKRSLPLVWAHRSRFIFALALSVAALAVGNSIPLVTRYTIDDAITRRTAPLVPFVIGLLSLALVQFAVGTISRILIVQTGFDMEYDLRAIIYEHLTRLGIQFHVRNQIGQLVSRANSDVRAVQSFLTFAPAVATLFVGAVFAFAVMMTINVPLTVVALCTMPFVYWAGARMRDRLFPVSWLVQARSAEVATIVEENVAGTRLVKAFVAEQRQVRLLAAAATRLRWAGVRQVDIQAFWTPVLQSLPSLSLAFVLLYGGWLIIRHQVSIGSLVAFDAYVLMMQAPFRMLGLILAMGQVAAASAQRVYEVLDTPVDIVDAPKAYDLVDPRGEVEFDRVVFGYSEGDAPILDGFTLRLSPGETVALVGSTGSGKTTVARLLNRFYDVREGAVRVDGRDVRDLSLTSLRATVGMVPDEPFLFSASLTDNIAYGRPGVTHDQVRAAAQAAAADEFIDDLPDGYGTVVGERGYTLSGGQRQRIAIARTVLMNPRILVLDDATSAIDVQIELLIHAALADQLGRRTTLIIAHRLSTIGLADRVALLEGGRVVAEGTHQALLAGEPRYARVLAHVEEEDAEKAKHPTARSAIADDAAPGPGLESMIDLDGR